VNAPELLIAFHSNNPGAIRRIKKEKEDCAQGMCSYETEEHTTSAKPQPHTGGCKVMYLRSAETGSKESAAMTEPGQTPPSYSHTSSRQTQRSRTTTHPPLHNEEHIQEFARRFQEVMH
jgi:hypothetical protein